MVTCIESVKRNVNDTVKRLLDHMPSMEIAIIAHGDYCDENSTYLLKNVDFTRNTAVICSFVTNVGHTGGGNFDEGYEYVMPTYKQNTLKIDWKEEAKLLRDNGIKIMKMTMS